VAADPDRERHIMTQTACRRRRFPVLWLDAGGDPSRQNHANSTIRPPLDTPHTATEIPIARFRDRFRNLSRPPGASFAPTVIIGAKIKPP
jgi:hypothetical protein